MQGTWTWRGAILMAALTPACVSSGLEHRLDAARQDAGMQPELPLAPSLEVPGLGPDVPVSWATITSAVLARNPRLESMRAA